MDYVLVLAKKNWFDGQVLVIEKNRPEFQRGRLNLVGGKVEPGETVSNAAVRELLEETGLIAAAQPLLSGVIKCGSTNDKIPPGNIYCYIIYTTNGILKPNHDETEKVFWVNWDDLVTDKRLMPNLKVIIPMMMLNSNGWEIQDDGPNWDMLEHTFTVKMPSPKIILK